MSIPIHFGPLLRRASLRHLVRHPWQMGLAVLGVALGVAVVVAIGLANASAGRAFALSTETVAGRATHQVTGGPAGLPDGAYRRLVLAGVRPAAPVVESYLTIAAGRSEGSNGGRRTLRLLGVDPFAERPFRPYLSGLAGAGRIDLAPFLTRPGAVLLAAGTAAELGLAPGSRFAARAGGAERTLLLAGLLSPADETARRALADLAVADVATAQEIAGTPGRLDRIDLLVPSGEPGRRLLARARALLPAGATIAPTAARSRTTEEMTRSFRVNLTALSLLALVCGAFLIYNTITFSVVQRRTLLGTLRALGVTRGQVFALVLGEALAVGALGTAAGLFAGVALGRGLVRLVTQTINDLYFVLAVRGLALAPGTLLRGAALGLGATLLAALAPALEATLAPPRAVLTRSSIEERLRRALPRTTAAGAALVLAGAGLLALEAPLAVAFSGLFAVILGCALLTPAATVGMMRLVRPILGRAFGVLGRMAARSVVAGLSRTAVAVAALEIAVSVTVGVGVMIGSFRGSVVRWLETSLQADLYVAPADRAAGFAGAMLPPEIADRAARLPGVARVHRLRRAEVDSPRGPVRLAALEPDRRAIHLVAGEPAAAWRAFAAGGLLASEPLARRLGLGVGSALPLATAEGVRPFRVAGVYRDYASDRGIAMLDLGTYRRRFGDRRLSGFSVDLSPGIDPARAARAVERAAGPVPLAVQANRALKRGSLAVFDRTFRITGVLRLLAGLVAAIGVLSALLALQLERVREIGVLRANGLTPGQVGGLVTLQTGLLGLAAGLLALPVGLALAAIMLFVVNRRSFGWTVDLAVAPEVLAQALLLAVGTALLAGLYPAWRMARISPAEALREE